MLDVSEMIVYCMIPISYTVRYKNWGEWSFITLAGPALQLGSESWSLTVTPHIHFISATRTTTMVKETRTHREARDTQTVKILRQVRPEITSPSEVVESPICNTVLAPGLIRQRANQLGWEVLPRFCRNSDFNPICSNWFSNKTPLFLHTNLVEERESVF